MESADKKNGKWQKVKKFLLFSLIALVLLIFISQIVWKFSGSNQWKFDMEKNGIKVFTLKTPGSDVLKVKATAKVKAKLASIVALMQDQTTCQESGCLNARVIEEKSEQLSYVEFSFPFPFNLQDREFVVKSLFYQHAPTKELFWDFTAEPGIVPLNDCCFRVTHYFDFWKFTPLDNGEVEIELLRDIDPGGFVPDWMTNSFMPYGAYDLLNGLQEMLDREKYQNAKFNFITEVGQQNMEELMSNE